MSRPVRRRRLPGWHFFKVRAESIPSKSKAGFAIKEAIRFGATGKELSFALMTIKQRVLATKREMFSEAKNWQQLEGLRAMAKANEALESTTMKMIDGARADARKVRAPKAAAKKPPAKLEGLREKLAAAVGGVVSFGRDENIRTRHNAFKNLMNETRKPECNLVCQWLVGMGNYRIHQARQAKSYSMHADQADFSMRCYGAAGYLYGKHGFKEKEFELQKLCRALNARLGLA